MVSSLSFGSCLRETKIALASECASMFSTSSCERSGSIGMAMRPNAVIAKNATLQLGMFSESMATLSEAPMPKLERILEMLSQQSLNWP